MQSLHAWAEHFNALEHSVLPWANAFSIWTDRDRGLVLQVVWNLGQDASGHWQRTRPVRVIVSSEALSDYGNSGTARREAADERFRTWLAAHLKSFDRTPDGAWGRSVPEEWICSTLDLNP